MAYVINEEQVERVVYREGAGLAANSSGEYILIIMMLNAGLFPAKRFAVAKQV